MKRFLLWLLGIVTAAFIIFVIGPFTFWSSVVPHLSPVLPKPDGVPGHAQASFNWKGPGMAWNWDDEMDEACVRWMAADIRGSVRIVELYQGEGSCNNSDRALARYSFSDTNTYGHEGNDWQYEACPFSLTDDQIAAYRQSMEEARLLNDGELESQVLGAVIAELDVLGGSTLKEAQFGCRADFSATATPE